MKFKKNNFIWFHNPHERNICLSAFLVPIIVGLLVIGIASLYRPTYLLSAFRYKPPPITQSDKTLPQSTQNAIEQLANEEIQQLQAQQLLATNRIANIQNVKKVTTTISSNRTQSQENTPVIIQNITETIQEALTTDPAEKATIRFNTIERLLTRIENLLTYDKSEKAVDQAIAIVKDIRLVRKY